MVSGKVLHLCAVMMPECGLRSIPRHFPDGARLRCPQHPSLILSCDEAQSIRRPKSSSLYDCHHTNLFLLLCHILLCFLGISASKRDGRLSGQLRRGRPLASGCGWVLTEVGGRHQSDPGPPSLPKPPGLSISFPYLALIYQQNMPSPYEELKQDLILTGQQQRAGFPPRLASPFSVRRIL